ncbi:BpFREP17.2 [Biomphalaria pfeifferi]|uniref:BpFREP17.2 n=1 Tax=Biomphalaria pfeifferi TaxID=112525 RepID=A0AAD8FFK0_BIOPF|nr:BpFREP17.2 [Biomphalaria pfeifferi]
MAFFLSLALWAYLAFWSASELVIDVQPNVISPEITPQLVINCSITNNQVQQTDVIKSLTLSRYNETIKEFDDLFVLNSSTLDLKQLQQFKFSQISFGNLYITLTLNNPSQFDAKVYRCNATGDNAAETSISLFAKKAVEYETSSTAFIEEIRRLKQDKNNCQCSLRSQKSRLQFNGSSEIIRELIEPLTLKCSFTFFNDDNQKTSTLQSLFILHETKGVIAYINKGQPVVTAMEEVKSKNVKGEIYQNKLKDSYLQVTWTNLKLSDSGKYFCEAHVQYLEGRSEKFNEMLTITVQSPTLNDLVNVIQKVITHVEEDKASIQLSKQNVENIREDVNTHHQDIKTIRKEKERNKENITGIKEVLDTITHNMMSIRVDTNNTITMLNKDMDTNARNIKIMREDIHGNLTKLREDLDTNEQLQINLQKNLKMEVANISTDLSELRNQMVEELSEMRNNIERFISNVNSTQALYPKRLDKAPNSCRQVKSTKDRVVVTLASGLKVMCDTTTDGGGWIIIQRRINGELDFFRGWNEYRDGFGDHNIGEFYLGNENIFLLTSRKQQELRFDLKYKNRHYFARYSDFKLFGEKDKYQLKIGRYSGNAGDSMKRHHNLFFTTFDKDNDNDNNKNCADARHGAWWYDDCADVNLNGRWGRSEPDGAFWDNVTVWDSVSFSEIKIRENE